MTDNTMAKRKLTNNNLQNITQKTKDRRTQISLKAGATSGAPEGLGVETENRYHDWKCHNKG